MFSVEPDIPNAQYKLVAFLTEYQSKQGHSYNVSVSTFYFGFR